MRPDTLRDTFLQDYLADVGAEAANHLARQSLSVIQEPVRAAASQHLPSTYLVRGQDRGTPVAAQRQFARRSAVRLELDTGHHPFFVRPDLTTDLLLGLA